MYQAKKSIQKKSLSALKKDFINFLQDNNKIFCGSLRRWIFLDKQPQAILERKDAKYRLHCFFVGIEILKYSRTFKKWIGKKGIGYCIENFSKDGFQVTIHLREEVDIRKDKKLFLISVYYK